MQFDLRNTTPPAKEFRAFRRDAGWGGLDLADVQTALDGGLINVTAYAGDEIAGFGRVVGDGILYFSIHDLIVREDFRRLGLGARLMCHLLEEIEARACPGAMIGVMAATGKEAFYEGLGFVARPTDIYGAGMTLLVK